MDEHQRRDLYSNYVEKHRLPLFFQSWYLDQVCGAGSWDVSLVLQDNRVIAVWPYFRKKKYGISYITTPPLTAYMGPWYQVPESITKEASLQSYHKKVLSELSQGLPNSHLIDTRWLPEMPNWMALSWGGYQQSSRYTYRIDLTHSEEVMFKAMTDSQRNTIRKSMVAYDVSQENDAQEFWKLNKTTFARQGLAVPYTMDFFHSLHATLKQHNAIEIWMAKDKQGSQGGACIAYDAGTAYLLATGRQEHKNGAVSAAIWSAILSAQKRGCKTFDFGGSMIEGVSSYFRSFGGTLTPYNRIIKNQSKLWEIVFRILNRF